ncbi:RING-type domain-containing protein [Durusdinium trenchii]|uniref:RING-type domain-containing protein n=1 Tax=Durusdinium trenchii TaxID=1381693 RepID=A0ABP0MWW0_9DINO
MVGNLIAESGAQRCSQRKALQLLRVDEQIQVPVLVQMLQVDVDFLFNEPKPGKADGLSSAVVYFPCFWQAMHELQKRLGGDPMDKGTEPFAEEASSFRDAILDLAASQRLTTASFADLVIAFKGTSTDQRAWDSLLESLRFLMRETKATKHIDCSRTLQQLILAQEPMPMAFVASILLPWIFELCEDYRRGERAGLLRAVRDVLGCSLRDACELLAKGKWDLETALRQHDLQNQFRNDSDAFLDRPAGLTASAGTRMLPKSGELRESVPFVLVTFELVQNQQSPVAASSPFVRIVLQCWWPE